MTSWYMLTLVGSDQPGIVAKITGALHKANCNLGEASMMRLGGNFTVMLMVNSSLTENEIKSSMKAACDELALHIHIDQIEGRLHQHHIPDVLVIVSGADREGIVAEVTELLFNAGMDILDLNSDVAGSEANPLYIMQIEGIASKGIASIENAVKAISHDGIDIQVQSIDTIVG